MPAYQRSHSSRRRWTSSDRAGSHSLSNDQNLTPSDGPGAADDGDHRETDISNDQLSAPIEALRGLADAAAAAAAEESEGHTSNDSSDEKNHGTDDNPSRSGRGAGDADAASVLQQGDEPTERNAARHEDKSGEGGGQSPRKKRRRDTNGASPNAAGGASAASDTQAGVGGTGTTPKASGSMGVGAAAPSPSNAAGGAGRSGKMEAPGLVTSAPGDLVTLGLVTESDAMRLFETFQKGVPKFISIFHLEDEPMTTAEAYHHVRTTSYFLFNVMLAIGAKVECGGKSPSRLYQTCMAQAKRNAKDTMFSPVAGKSAVQAMVLLAAYSENGWLPLGLSIRMAQELGLDRSFQKLMSALPASGYIKHPQPPPPPKHLTFYHNSPQSSHYTGSPTDVNSVGGESMDGKTGANVAGANAVAAVAAANGNADAAAKRELDELKDLARGARLWFFLFLFDHQASYGAGRPAMLSKHYVRNCRAFLSLDYPLTVKTDARFISTLELLIIRETHYDAMAPYDQPVDARMLSKMRKVTEELNEWHQYWSTDFESRGYAHDSFFQQSLILQCASAELYLSCTALRGIRDANDADQMGPEQKELIIQATRAADTCLSISVNAKEYREMLGWAPHYTHVTAAFACVFLIKIARLFPRQVDTYGIFSNAERLASRLAEVPASKYARVIRILLAQAWKKIADLSPAIGLYAALGAEATRPGAITPAEIKSGGPSDSGISLLYKLLQEYQNGQLEGDEDAGRGEGGAQSVHADGAGAGGEGASGARTPGFGDLANSSKWLMTGISSPSVGGAALGAAGSGAMSPNKAATAGLFSHRGSISGFDQHVGGSTGNAGNDGLAWSSLIGAGTPSASHGGGAFISDGSLINATTHQPIQLPLWMQESTGGAGDLGAFDTPAGGAPEASEVKPAAAARSWGHQDHYQSPVPHASQYTSPVYQTPRLLCIRMRGRMPSQWGCRPTTRVLIWSPQAPHPSSSRDCSRSTRPTSIRCSRTSAAPRRPGWAVWRSAHQCAHRPVELLGLINLAFGRTRVVVCVPVWGEFRRDRRAKEAVAISSEGAPEDCDAVCRTDFAARRPPLLNQCSEPAADGDQARPSHNTPDSVNFAFRTFAPSKAALTTPTRSTATQAQAQQRWGGMIGLKKFADYWTLVHIFWGYSPCGSRHIRGKTTLERCGERGSSPLSRLFFG